MLCLAYQRSKGEALDYVTMKCKHIMSLHAVLWSKGEALTMKCTLSEISTSDPLPIHPSETNSTAMVLRLKR
jgi:hypothetical protein